MADRIRATFSSAVLYCFLAVLSVIFFLSPAAVSAGAITEYRYDAVGNIVAIESSGTALHLSLFSPASGPVGAEVVIYGSGFSPDMAGNTVLFNGATASVSRVSQTTLAVQVPPGATTGPISVTVNGNTVTSIEPFTVSNNYGTPAIHTFSPECGVIGTEVTVYGDRFDPTSGTTRAGIGEKTGIAQVISLQELTFSIPVNAASGPVTVSTPGGKEASRKMFFIPPVGYGVTCLNTGTNSLAIIPGESRSISLNSSKKQAFFFQAATGDLLSLFFSQLGATSVISYELYSPAGTPVTNSTFNSTTRSLPIPVISLEGTYLLVLSTRSADSVTLNLRLTRDPIMQRDGDPATYTTTQPKQPVRFGFIAESGQSLGIGLTGFSYDDRSIQWQTAGAQVFGPDGRIYSSNGYTGSSTSCYPAYGRCDLNLPVIKQSGLYSVLLTPTVDNAMTVTAVVSSNRQAVLQKGSPYLLSINRSGQDGWLSFEGVAGQSNSILLSAFVSQPVNSSITVYVFKSDGNLLKNTSMQSSGGRLSLGNLPATDTYRVWISPYQGATGSVTVTLQ